MKNLPPDGQSRWAKATSQPVNFPLLSYSGQSLFIGWSKIYSTGLISLLLILGFGKKPKHLRSKTWDAANGRDSPSSPSPPPGTNGKKGAASYAPKKDRESFRSALVNIIM